MEATGVFLAATILAFAVEALLELTMGVFWKPLANDARKKLVMAVGTVLGVALALVYKIDLLAEMGLAPSLAGQIITGALVGRGSEFLHAFYGKLKR